jgi:hypothetical protein
VLPELSPTAKHHFENMNSDSGINDEYNSEKQITSIIDFIGDTISIESSMSSTSKKPTKHRSGLSRYPSPDQSCELTLAKQTDQTKKSKFSRNKYPSNII